MLRYNGNYRRFFMINMSNLISNVDAVWLTTQHPILKKKIIKAIYFIHSMEGSDLCFEVVRRAIEGFVYSEAVAW